MNKLNYIISLVFSAVVCYYGITGVKAAQYLIVFLTWFGVIGILIVNSNQKLKQEINKSVKSPVCISTIVSLIYIGVYLYYMWVWTAFGQLIILMCRFDMWKNNNLKEKNNE